METMYRIRESERELAQAVLTSAFHEEIDIMTRNFGLKRRAAEGMFSIPLRLGFSKGEVYASSGQMEGLMALVPGEHANPGLLSLVTSGSLFRFFGALKLILRKEVRSLFTQLSRDKKALHLGPYYYLAVLGVSQEHQGKGVGGKLLSTLCKRADTEGRSLYLETQNRKNVAWYEGYNFKVIKKLGSAGSMELWEMVRLQEGSA